MRMPRNFHRRSLLLQLIYNLKLCQPYDFGGETSTYYEQALVELETKCSWQPICPKLAHFSFVVLQPGAISSHCGMSLTCSYICLSWGGLYLLRLGIRSWWWSCFLYLYGGCFQWCSLWRFHVQCSFRRNGYKYVWASTYSFVWMYWISVVYRYVPNLKGLLYPVHSFPQDHYGISMLMATSGFLLQEEPHWASALEVCGQSLVSSFAIKY